MFKQDYILRLVEELAQAVAKVLKGNSESKLESLESELERAEQELGVIRGAETLTARSLAGLLGGDKCVLYAELLLARAALLERRGSTGAASARRRRAQELLVHSRPEQLLELKAELLAQAERAVAAAPQR